MERGGQKKEQRSIITPGSARKGLLAATVRSARGPTDAERRETNQIAFIFRKIICRTPRACGPKRINQIIRFYRVLKRQGMARQLLPGDCPLMKPAGKATLAILQTNYPRAQTHKGRNKLP